MSGNGYIDVRCPHCGKLAVEASAESTLRLKCSRCKKIFEWKPQRMLQRP